MLSNTPHVFSLSSTAFNHAGQQCEFYDTIVSRGFIEPSPHLMSTACGEGYCGES